MHGFDYYNTKTGDIESGGADKIAVWLLDTDYDGRSLFPRQVFFPMAGEKEGWARLAKNLKAEIDEDLIEAYRGTVSLPFEAGEHRRVGGQDRGRPGHREPEDHPCRVSERIPMDLHEAGVEELAQAFVSVDSCAQRQGFSSSGRCELSKSNSFEVFISARHCQVKVGITEHPGGKTASQPPPMTTQRKPDMKNGVHLSKAAGGPTLSRYAIGFDPGSDKPIAWHMEESYQAEQTISVGRQQSRR